MQIERGIPETPVESEANVVGIGPTKSTDSRSFNMTLKASAAFAASAEKSVLRVGRF